MFYRFLRERGWIRISSKSKKFCFWQFQISNDFFDSNHPLVIRKKYIPSYKKILEQNASMTYQNRKFIKYLKTYSTDCERRESSKGKISSRIFGRKKKLPKPLIHFSVIFRRVFGSLAHSTSIQFLLISNSKDDFEKIWLDIIFQISFNSNKILFYL